MNAAVRTATARAVPAAALLGLLAACATPGSPTTVAIDSDVRLSNDVRVALPDRSTLVYRGLANDSRCPRNVYCIHAGSVQVLFAYDAGAGAAPMRIEAPRTLSGPLGTRWRLHLVDVAAATPQAVDVRIEPVR